MWQSTHKHDSQIQNADTSTRKESRNEFEESENEAITCYSVTDLNPVKH